MDSRIGLDYIVENREYVEKLGAALDTKNGTVKKQVFELLSALSAYSKDGYSRALETLDNYKELKDERYRFKIVVLELENTTTIEYQIALLQFINCIIISTKQLQDRIRIRNEFIGLTLLPILNKLRREATNFPDLGVQLDVFDEQRECDEAQSLQGPDGINLNSHLDVFYAIYNQVADTRQEIPFLNILQHLLRIDSKEAVSDIIWDTAETLLHRATLLENREDSARLLRSPSISHFQCPYCRGDPSSPSQRKQSLSTSHLIPASPLMPPSSSSPPACAPPPPPPPPSISAPPPPPPPMFSGGSIPNAPPPAPPPNFLQAPTDHDGISRPKTPECPIDPISRLPQQETPVPKSKMKTINWNKIPPNKVMGRHNIWSIVADSHKKSPMADMDWAEMEGLFCQQPTSGQGSPKLGRDTGGNGDTLERKSRKENSEITLLDGKRSLNVNIFLKQFRSTNEDIVQLIHEGDHDSIGAEKLRGLLKILPEIDELDVLKSFDGDKNRLGNAEKFLLQLTQVPNYKLRIESMLLKEEFTANLSYLEPNINVMLYTGEELMNNKLLQEVLYMIVVAGNFLNSGGYAGNAAGVKLSSLQKLTDIRANKPGMNLIHYVALQAEKKNKELLTFTNELTGLENSSKISVEQLNNEITTLETRTKKICRQVDLPNTDCDIKVQMVDFLAAAETHIAMLQDGIAEIDKLRLQLSDFFCEDPATFKLEECFKIFHNFSEKFKQAVNENERRRIQEEQANQRRKMREEQMARKRQSSSTPVSDFENGLTIDSSYYELRSSPAMNRRNVRNGDAILNGKREDGGPSPDITPNGSLRRRRSRVLSEEDDGLMDYLRSSGHDSGTRERKSTSYGSLDRSWARRARTGNSKNRPALLSVDFNADRERPTSPSQNIDAQQLSTPSTPEDNKPRGPRGWQQRIESWIQTNEQDEKQNDDYTKRASERRRKSSSIRRSFENDSENERKLDPLPEEEHRRPHHSDWNPSSTLDKTDVVGALEAIEDAQPHHTPISKDKSLLRKSNLNVSNCTGDTTETTRNRTIPSSSSSSPSTPLHSIIEEDRRRIFIHQLGERGASDRLKIYIRRPSNETSALVTGGDQELNINKSNEIIPNNSSSNNNKQVIYIKSQQDAPSLASVAKKSLTPHLSYHPLNNNSEIDSDNIETPPVMRKHIGGGRSADHEIIEKKNLINPPDQEILGDGQFDRFSSTRRTRRVKRPINNSSGAEEKLSEYENVKLHEIDAPQIILDGNDSIKIIQTAIPTMVETTESRMKRWQEKKAMKAIDNDEALMQAKLIRNTRHLTSINQKDVQDAKQNLKSPTEIPERICFDRRQSIELNVTKPIIQELNDEGFEETQSLVSDTPSQGKDSTSSCNDVTDAKLLDKAQTQRVNLLRRHGSERLPKRITPQKPSMNSLLTKNQDLIQHRTIRGAPISTTPSPAARRENQLRKTDSSGSLRRSITPSLFNNIERSNSRASLRSSRSSLNSGVSTNTIKKMPSKVSSNLKKSLSADSPAKRPLNVQNNHNKSNTRVPASRSSSSGSSIGANQNSRRPPTSSPSKILSSASFKENRRSVGASPNHQQKSSSSSNVPSANASPIKSQSSTTSQNNSTGSVVRRTGGFMRATTASATKVNGARGK